MMKFAKTVISLLGTVAIASCASINCQLNNTVYTTFGFYQDSAQAVKLVDTLTVTAAGTDSILINRDYDIQSIELPMSYNGDVDIVTLRCDNLGSDTLWIYHTNYPYYQAPECGVAMFHVITKLESTHNFIYKTEVVKPSVNFDGTENVRIYFKNQE